MIDLEFMESRANVTRVKIIKFLGMRFIRKIYHFMNDNNLDPNKMDIKYDPVARVILLRMDEDEVFCTKR